MRGRHPPVSLPHLRSRSPCSVRAGSRHRQGRPPWGAMAPGNRSPGLNRAWMCEPRKERNPEGSLLCGGLQGVEPGHAGRSAGAKRRGVPGSLSAGASRGRQHKNGLERPGSGHGHAPAGTHGGGAGSGGVGAPSELQGQSQAGEPWGWHQQDAGGSAHLPGAPRARCPNKGRSCAGWAQRLLSCLCPVMGATRHLKSKYVVGMAWPLSGPAQASRGPGATSCVGTPRLSGS